MAIERPIRFPAVAGTPDYTINDRSKIPTSGAWAAPYYFIGVDQVDGFWGADVSYESHPIPGKIGERSGDVFRRGKSIVLTGRIEARGLSTYREAERFLNEMFWDTSKRKLHVQFWNDGFEIYITCRLNQDLTIVENKNAWSPASGFKGQWTVGLRADNPRTYKTSDNTLYPTWQT